jgi:CDP-paratose 2-epimerase
MAVAVVTGAAGLLGSEASRFLDAKGLEVVGIDNDMRAYFFGADGSTAWNRDRLESDLQHYTHCTIDMRDREGVDQVFSRYGEAIELVVHCAAQPSHDWAAREPETDFTINALATVYLLEAARQHAPDCTFIFVSTNKVYGDTPNQLPLIEQDTRWECDPAHAYAEHGIDEAMSIDQSRHSVFGASKVAADVMCQEFGRCYGLKTGIFRGGCLTGPAHSGVQLHGFLSYLVKCNVQRIPYTIYGYGGKQVRDNIHSSDLINAFWHFHQAPRAGAVYNIGGSRHSHCSVREAIAVAEDVSGIEMTVSQGDEARAGDHIWWVSDVRRFRRDYPAWDYHYSLRRIVEEIAAAQRERGG